VVWLLNLLASRGSRAGLIALGTGLLRTVRDHGVRRRDQMRKSRLGPRYARLIWPHIDCMPSRSPAQIGKPSRAGCFRYRTKGHTAALVSDVDAGRM